MRAILVFAFLCAACRMPQPQPPIKPVPNCIQKPQIAASCPGIAMYGIAPDCMRCWKTDYYADDPSKMLLGCYSAELDIYCTNSDGCDDSWCAAVPVVNFPQSHQPDGGTG